jgi:hypothetical protein
MKEAGADRTIPQEAATLLICDLLCSIAIELNALRVAVEKYVNLD